MAHGGKGFARLSLRKKALIIFLLFVILPTVGVGFIVQYKYQSVLRDQYVSAIHRNLDNVASQLSEQTKMVTDMADYLILSPDMRLYLRSYPMLSEQQKADLKNNIENFLTFQLMSKSYIRSIEIVGNNGNSIQMGEPFTGDETLWQDKARAMKGGLFWSPGYDLHSAWYGQVKLFSLIRVLNSYVNITEPLGLLTIRMDEQSIVSELEKGILANSGGTVYLLGPEGELLLASNGQKPRDYEPYKEQIMKLARSDRSMSTIDVDGKPHLVLYNHMPVTDWTLVAMIPKSHISAQYQGAEWMMTAILTAIVLLALAAFYGFNYTIIRPILRLKKETVRVAGGDFSVRVPIESQDEIADLSRKFNAMVGTIEELIEHKYKLELSERESELKLLQNQVDPHFLYNTLDMIRWTARLEKADKSSRLIEMLSKFFRARVGNNQHYTTLAKEMEFVEAYLFLQQYRLGDKLRYKLFLEPELEDAPSLKALIQPLVENYFKHGIDKEKSAHIVEVIGYRHEDEIRIDVSDNGKGIPSERMAELMEALQDGLQIDGMTGRRGALFNIHERLTISFGAHYGLGIVESSPEGTVIRLRLPIIKAKS
ncbi:cache domain-containing sensor histidine kinase [Paenibacillus glycanilyticus]|uniref:Two-component sensor histidine kinase n=1 Tax=Paenibacillus glycanilyticus TaxID=126569 RepID=A0ABQ6GFN2_9BACL|nr:sensor histidine kinase [Paenibacillus glycanilyticus]GLX69759.1 two-component sensor histidine kinase [Paenibacillus glycanilyticus]